MSQAVFISYASKDKGVADAVCRALEQDGVRCWIAPRDILPGMEYATAIIDALNTCQLFLVIFSETSNSSPQVAREVERAISKNRTVLTFRIDNTILSKAMEYYLSDRHWLDASSGKLTQHLDNLVKAVKVLEAAMPLMPNQEESAQKKAQEIKDVQDKARWDVLLAKADEAIKAAHWEDAAALLKDALVIKPDKAVEAKLLEVRSQQRSASLVELKTQAQELVGADRLNEAIEVWNGYLALEPDDQEEVENTLQDLRKSAKIANDYVKAQEALHKKHYDRAITLLREIITQQPSYKDSSRILKEAEQAKKSTPSWRRYWLLEGLGAMVIILLGIFFGPKLWAAISTPIQQPAAAEITNSSTGPFTAITEPGQPPATAKALDPIPDLPADLDSLKPILTYVTSVSPDFSDDFSKVNPSWESFQEGITLNDGILRLAMQAGTPTEKIGLASEYVNADNFWLEFDFFFMGSNANAFLDGGFASTGNGEGTNCDISIDLGKQNWFIGLTDNSVGKSGHFGEVLKGKWSHLLVIYSNNQVVTFLDGELLDHVEDINKSGDRIWIVGTTTGQAEIWLDNVKFWNLDSLSNTIASPSPPVNPPATAAANLELMPAFFSSVQNYMAGQTPSFEDDFSSTNNSWYPFPAGVTVKYGVLQMTLEAGTPTEKIGLYSPYMNASNFGLEFDIYSEGVNKNSILNVGFTSIGDIDGTNYDVNIDLENSDWSMGLSNNPDQISGRINDSLSRKWNHLRIIYSNAKVASFLNDELLGFEQGISKSKDEIWIVAITGGQAKIWLDNLQYWDLDKMPGLP